MWFSQLVEVSLESENDKLIIWKFQWFPSIDT